MWLNTVFQTFEYLHMQYLAFTPKLKELKIGRLQEKPLRFLCLHVAQADLSLTCFANHVTTVTIKKRNLFVTENSAFQVLLLIVSTPNSEKC